MPIRAFSYVGVRAPSLSEWHNYGTRQLGMQVIDSSRGSIAFRMDDRRQRLVVKQEPGPPAAFFGWEVADAAALDALAARIEQAGRVTRGSRALADERFVQDLI